MAVFGAATNLVAGTLTLTLPDAAKYWYIQNQDTGALKITFSNASFGPVTLNAATATGAAGDWLDSIGFPFFGSSVSVVLTSSVTTAQFGSGYATSNPTNTITG